MKFNSALLTVLIFNNIATATGADDEKSNSFLRRNVQMFDLLELDSANIRHGANRCNSDDPCGECQGDCNSDDDCEGDLVCYQKDAATNDNEAMVPGCLGRSYSQTDWCVRADATASDNDANGGSSTSNGSPPKNVIMLIPDGCDEGVLGLARWYKNEDLFVDQLARGSVHPYMANSLMTDSAPGGTAYSSGQLTTDKFIAVGPRRSDLLSTLDESTLWDAYAPIPTVLEKAKMMGKATGLVSTSRITHATPAAFAAHVDARSKERQIHKQMVFNGVDVAFGGGRRNMLPNDECVSGNSTSEVPGDDEYSSGAEGVQGSREDCLNLEAVLAGRGYDICTTRDELMQLDGEKAWCSFASSHMSPDLDRPLFKDTEPTLAEMTAKAIELLSKNENGFFLMVEGSQVDWAGHANDPVWMVTDFIAWDDSVKVAVEWAEANGDTVVLALPDHNTGGLKVGGYNFEYVNRTVEFAREPLLGMKMTSNGVTRDMNENTTAAELKASVLENWGIDLSDDIAEQVLSYSAEYSAKFESNPVTRDDKKFLPLNYALSRIVSEEYTIAGWTSHGHTGEDVPMWVYGMDPPRGYITNTEVGLLTASLFGGLEGLEDELYVDVDTAGLEWSVNTTDVTNEYAMVGGILFPLDRDYLVDPQGNQVSLPGITVYAPMTDKLYISAEAIAWVTDPVNALGGTTP